MGAFSFFFASFLLFISLNFHPGLCRKAAGGGGDEVTSTGREAIEISKGGGGTFPSPSLKCAGDGRCTAPPPPPGCFENGLLERDYYTIQRFVKRIEADPCGYTTTWTGTDICKYRGFACEKLRDKTQLNALAAIDFNGANFEGKDLRLDEFLEELNELAIFHGNSNKFIGKIPLNITKLQYLYELDLSNNMLSGDFPMEVLQAKNVTFLDLRFNNFKGVVPREVFNLDLDVLFMNNNGFTQTLPDNIGDTTALYLTFANNNFTGPIPSSIGKAKNLLEVLFLNNQLSGCLPPEIGFLNKAILFDAGFNKLTGPIPYSFGCLMKMQILNLAVNEMYGAVPEIVCQLPNIANLSLSFNYFTQVGAECRKLIVEKKLDVRQNCISGVPDQRSGAECAAFFSQRRCCPNQKLMKWIPCKDALGSNRTGTNSDVKKSIGPSAGFTYGTLVPHRP